jgi:hypothetical protein
MRRMAPPVLDYTGQRPRVAVVAWQSVVAIVGGFLFVPSFMCTCGHLDVMALIATVPTAWFAWWGFARRLSFVGRALAGCVVALVSVAFLKNLLDIGWFGHNPLLR